jgi:hypothetical protein
MLWFPRYHHQGIKSKQHRPMPTILAWSRIVMYPHLLQTSMEFSGISLNSWSSVVSWPSVGILKAASETFRGAADSLYLDAPSHRHHSGTVCRVACWGHVEGMACRFFEFQIIQQEFHKPTKQISHNLNQQDPSKKWMWSCPCVCHKVIWRSGDIAPFILIFDLRWSEWSALRPDRYTPEERTPP